MSTEFYYSDKYEDDTYEYRHVQVPKDVLRRMPKNRLLSESEWRGLGVQQSAGWEHYAIHAPEPHILLFRRLKPKKQSDEDAGPKNKTGKKFPLY
ncbi:CDC28 protein kinase regulatory subunit 1B [Aphelenchoides avenae]|nr:CDC28 protein kinase regulatory subunit 1B [Aphelenchus avenae]